MTVLVIDVGGTNLKVSVGGDGEVIKIPSGPEMTAALMAKEVKKATAGRSYDCVSIGYPGPVTNGRPAREPHNLGAGWVRFDYAKAFGKPVRRTTPRCRPWRLPGGRMLYPPGAARLRLRRQGRLEPLELAICPTRKNRTWVIACATSSE
jgi:hypothetical protein